MYGSCAEQLSAMLSNPIAPLELLAVCVGLAMWAPLLADLGSLIFVDNEAAKHALVKGSSPEKAMASVTDAACAFEIAARTTAYYERVPSASNPADLPSRGHAPVGLQGWPAPLRLSYDEWLSSSTGLRGAAGFWADVGGCMRPGLEHCRSTPSDVLERLMRPIFSAPSVGLAERAPHEVAGHLCRGLRDLDLRTSTCKPN